MIEGRKCKLDEKDKFQSIDRKMVDSIKGISILGIVLVHCGLDTTNGVLVGIVNNGARGVQMLYLLNAFLIWNSLDKLEMSGERKDKDLLAWYQKRFIRIIPLYWFFTILHLLVFGIGERFYLGPLKKVSWLNILCNLTFLHGFYPYYSNSINANWYMANIAIWYIIAPFMRKYINSLERSLISLLVVVPADYILLRLLEKVPLISHEGIWRDYVTIMSFPAVLPILLLGIFVYYIYKEFGSKSHQKEFSIACIVFSILMFAIMTIGGEWFFNVFSNIYSYAIIFMVFLVGMLLNPIGLLCNRLFAIIGKYSYGIYLSHLIVLHFVSEFMVGMDTTNGFVISAVRYSVVCLLSFGVSVIGVKYIEKPILSHLRR